MVVSVRSLGLHGIAGYEVRAECFLSGGLPAFDIVGLPDTAVREARERVRAAVKNCGAKFPVSRITVNLAPAGQKKAGTVYDLPMWGCWPPPENSLRRRRTPPFWGSCPSPARCGASPAFCPWRWRPGKQGSERCSFRRKTLPRPRWPGGSPSAECRTSDPWCSI